jgi:hypothetical protein
VWKLITLTALALAIATSARAVTEYELKRIEVARELGNLLASEKACGLTYNHDAIESFIRERIPPTDLDFPGMLQDETRFVLLIELRDMSESSLIAHCYQIRQLAKQYNLIGK